MDVCIISNNCYGTPYYTKRGLQYNTPFIGLFLYGPCYIQLLEHFDEYIREPLVEAKGSKYGTVWYPVGLLKDIEIHFLHDKDFSVAKEAWDRRIERLLPFEDCILKICDRDLATEDHLERFLQLPHKRKILFLSKKWNHLLEKHKGSSTVLVRIADGYHECPDGYILERNYPIDPYLNTLLRCIN